MKIVKCLIYSNVLKFKQVYMYVYQQAQHLQKVLIKKRDPVTHVLFIEHLAKQSVSKIYIRCLLGKVHLRIEELNKLKNKKK